LSAAFLVVLTSWLFAADQAHANRWGRGYIPNVPVVTQHGETLNFYDDVVAGRRLVISFIFTSCRDMCPLITARLAQLYEALGPAAGRDIRFVSISVDPVNDTPAKLKEHADAFRVGPGWLFLTGTLVDITHIRHRLGDRSQNILDHRQDIWLVNEPTGDWQRDSAFGDIEQVVHALNAMVLAPDRVPSAQGPLTPRSSQTTGVILPGQTLYSRACAACHDIGSGDKVGPDLLGITRKREMSWLKGFIRTPQRYHAQNDPIALTLAERYKGVRMPNLGLKEADVVDLISYIEARTFAAENPAPAGHDHSAHMHPPKPAASSALRPIPSSGTGPAAKSHRHQHH
jgi:protein SCO1/2